MCAHWRPADHIRPPAIDRGGCCLYEACVDIPAQLWEPRILILDISADAVADAIEEEIELEPEHDGRITGCDRHTLGTIADVDLCLCYLADVPAVEV